MSTRTNHTSLMDSLRNKSEWQNINKDDMILLKKLIGTKEHARHKFSATEIDNVFVRGYKAKYGLLKPI